MPRCTSRVAVAALLLLAVLWFAAPPARAQVQDVYVSNLEQAPRLVSQSYRILSQAFTTGGHAGGYPVGSVRIGYADTEDSRFRATIHQPSDGACSWRLCNLVLTFNGSFEPGVLTFRAPENARLEANTTYELVLWNIADGRGIQSSVNYSVTTSSAEDRGGADGWSIGELRHHDNFGTLDEGEPVTSTLVMAVDPPEVETRLRRLGVRRASTGEFLSELDYPFSGIPTTVPLNSAAYAERQITFETDLLDADSGADVAILDRSYRPLNDANGDVAGFQANLGLGSNTFRIRVAAPGGFPFRTYTVQVRRRNFCESSPDCLVSNLDQSSGGSFEYDVHRTTRHGQPFRTGNSASGYLLNGIHLDYANVEGDFEVAIYSARRGARYDHPHQQIKILTPPANFAAGRLYFSSTPPLRLEGNSDYAVVLKVPIGNRMGRYYTKSTAEDSGTSPGWSIANNYSERNNPDRPSWDRWRSNLMKIAVMGSVAPSMDATLRGLELAYQIDYLAVGGLLAAKLPAELVPGFSSETTEYAAEVPHGTNRIVIAARPSNANASVAVLDGDESPLEPCTVVSGLPCLGTISGETGSFAVSVHVGETVLRLKVTSEDGMTSRTYAVRVTRLEGSGDPVIGTPRIRRDSNGRLHVMPGDDIVGFSRVLGGTFANQWVRVDADGASNEEEIRQATLFSYMPKIADAGRRIRVRVSFTDTNGDPRTLYSDPWPANGTMFDTSLGALSLADATGAEGAGIALRPAFSRDVTSYRANVANAVESVTVAATQIVPDSRVRILDGDGAELTDADERDGFQTPLGVGDNTIQVQVANADGGAMRTYTLAVARAAATDSADATLSGLALAAANGNAVVFAPGFAPTTDSYTANVGNAVRWITVAPATAHANATVAYRDANGLELSDRDADLPGRQIDLHQDENTIVLEVTAEDGVAMRAYTVTVARGPPQGAPGMPRNLTATPGDSFVRLAWDAPSDTGSGPVTGYETLRSNRSKRGPDDTYFQLPSDSNETRHPAKNGQPTTYLVRALNAAGAGPAATVTATSRAAACAAQAFGERRALLESSLVLDTGIRLSVFSDPIGYGFHDTAILSGTLASGASFAIGADRHSVSRLYASAEGKLLFAVDPALGERAALLRLHVCGSEYSLAGVTPDADGVYDLGDGHDWSLLANRSVALSWPANAPASGAPAIEADGGDLAVSTDGITDADGLPASFAYQWIRVDEDASNPVEIPGATAATYTPVFADYGKRLQARVRFTDLLGGEETLTSAAWPGTGTVTPPATCAAPDFGTRRHVWTGRVTVGGSVADDQFGYDERESIGSVDSRSFAIGADTHTLVAVYVINSNGNLVFRTQGGGPLPPGARLHVCDTALDIGDAKQQFPDQALYVWSVDRDWSTLSTVTVHLSLPANNAATGAPDVGTENSNRTIARVGEMFWANTDGITDADGLPGSFGYQWVRVGPDGVSEPQDIEGATSSNYMLTGDDVGRRVLLRVTFFDLGGSRETLESGAYPVGSTVRYSTCLAPEADDRTDLWTGNVTIGELDAGGAVIGHGYNFDGIRTTGGLDRTSFTIGEDSYSIGQVLVGADGVLSFALSPALPETQRAELRLYVCGWPYRLAEARKTTLLRSMVTFYEWDTSLHDSWPDIVRRTLRLSRVGNSPATGLPVIGPPVSGNARTGETLTAYTGGIGDADGLPDAFGYQWVRVEIDGASNPRNIEGATSRSYTLTPDDVGGKVLVRVTFSDRKANSETLLSAAYPSGAGSQVVDTALGGLDLLDSSPDADAYSPIDYTPAFAPEVTDYNAEVETGVTRVTVIGARRAKSQVVDYRTGSDTRSPGDLEDDPDGELVELDEGENLVEILVDAGFGDEPQAYRLSVTRANPPETQVSNADAEPDETAPSASQTSQAFRTGDNPGGYALSRIVLQGGGFSDANGNTVTLHRGSSTGTKVADFTAVAGDGGAALTLTPALAVTLAASTFYVIVTGNDLGSATWDVTDTRPETLPSGWSIDEREYRLDNDTWTTSAEVHLFSVVATAKNQPSITIDADRTTASAWSNMVKYTLRRTGPTEAALDAKVVLSGPDGHDWGLTEAEHEVTFAANSATTTLERRIDGSDSGIGFSDDATVSGVLTASVEVDENAGYVTDDTAEVAVRVPSTTSRFQGQFELSFTQRNYEMPEGGGPYTLTILARAESSDVDLPNVPLVFEVATSEATATPAEDYEEFAITESFQPTDCARDSEGVVVCTKALSRKVVIFDDAVPEKGRGVYLDNVLLEATEDFSVAPYDATGVPPRLFSVASNAQIYVRDNELGLMDVSVTSTPLQNPSGLVEPDTYGAREHIEFTARFNTRVTTAGNPTFTFDIGGTERTATQFRGAATDTLVYSYAVQGGDTGDLDSDGISWDANAFAAGSVEIAGTDAKALLVHEAQPDLDGHKVNGRSATARYVTATVTDVSVTSTPMLRSPGASVPDTYGRGEPILITVTFSEDVAVEGNPFFNFWLNDNPGSFEIKSAGYVPSRSTPNRLVFQHEVMAQDVSEDGIWIGEYSGERQDTFRLDAHQRIRVAANNVDVDLAHDEEGRQPGHKVDGSRSASPGAPEIRGTPEVRRPLTAHEGTIGDPDGLTATFPDDYGFQWILVEGSTETDIPGATSDTYVPVPGDMGKMLKVRVSFQDRSGNDETRTSAPTAPVAADSAALRVLSIVRQDPAVSPTNADSLTWRVTFSEDAANVDPADFMLTGTTAALAVAEATTSTVFDVTASGGDLADLNGTVTLGFAAAQNITDTADTPNALAETAPPPGFANEDTYDVDNTAPSVEITVPATSDAPFTATFTFSEPVTGFVLGDIAVANGAASEFTDTDGGTTYTATITPEADGGVTVDVAADAAEDAAGNGNVAAEPASSTYEAPGTNADLGALTLTNAADDTNIALTPTFDPATTEYTADADMAAKVTVTPETADGDATVALEDGDGNMLADADGDSANGHQVDLELGGNVVRIVVTAEDGVTMKEYAVTVTRDPDATVTGVAVTSTAPRYREATGVNVKDVYGAGDVIEFTVTFSAAVDVDTANGVPALVFGMGSGAGVHTDAAYARGSGTGTLVFAYTVQPGDSDDDGIFLLNDTDVTSDGGALQLNGGVIRAGADGAVSTATTTSGAQSGHKVDGSRSGPYVESLEVTSTPMIVRTGQIDPDTYGAGETIEFTLTLSEAVTVTGTPHLQFSLGDTDTNADYVRGSGSSKLAFAYLVQSGDRDDDGIFVQDGEDVSGNSAVVVESGESIAAMDDSADADLVNPGRGPRSGHKVDGSMSVFDTAAPTVLSIVRQDPADSPTNADSLTWRVTFSEDVANVDNTDFTAAGTTATLAVAEATASSVFDVTASGGDLAGLNGTVTLGFAAAQDITDTADTPNALAETAPPPGFANEDTYDVDNAAPTVEITAPAAANAPFTATFTFSEPVTGFTLTDIAVGNGTASDLTGGDGDTAFTATITPGADGEVTLDVAEDVAEDAAGNGNVAALRASTSADLTAPTVESVVRHDPAGSPTNADSLTWRVTFSEDVANVDLSDFTAAGTTATLAVAEATASSVFDVTASGGDLAGLNGTVTLGFATAQDIADTSTPPNALADTAPTGADERGWVVDNAAPTVSIAAPDAANAPFTATFTFSEPVTGFTLTDIAVGNGTASDLTGGDGDTAFTATITPGADGEVTLDVAEDVAEDAAGNGNVAALRASTSADLTAPTVESVVRHDPAGSPTNADSLTWRVTFSEDVANVDNTDFTAAGTTATLAVAEATASTVFDVTASGGDLAELNGTVTLGFAAAQDIADTSTPPNALAGTAPTGADERGWVVDNAAPTVSIAAPDAANAPFTATFTFSEPVTGFTLADIAVGNGTASDLTGGDGDTAFTATITPSAEGEVTVDVAADAAEDEAGNGNVAAEQVSVTHDMTRPTVTITAPDAANAPFTATFTFSGPVTGFALADIAVGNGAASEFTDTDGGTTYTATITPSAEGEVTLDVAADAAADAASNGNLAATRRTVDYDVTAPTVTITEVPDTSDGPFTATFTFSEPVTGFALGDIAVGNGTASDLTGGDGDTAFTATITPSAEGEVTVDVAANAAEDEAGNGSAAATQAKSTYAEPNTAPTAQDSEGTTYEDVDYAPRPTEFNFTDDDGDSLHSVIVTALPAAGKGELKIGCLNDICRTLTASDLPFSVSESSLADGDFTYVPPGNANGDAFATFRFRVSDGTDESVAEYTMTIDITPVNDAPALESPIGNQSATVDESFSFTVPDDAFGDIDGDTLAYSATLANDDPLPSWLTFTAATRTFQGTPATAGTLTVKVTVEDGGGETASDQFDIVVNEAPNAAPAFDDDELTRSVAENAGPGTNVGAPVPAATDSDGDSPTYTMEGADEASFDFDPATRQIATKAGVDYDFEAKAMYSVTITADDGKGGTDTVAVTISLTDVAEPPDAPEPPVVTATPGSTTSLDVSWTAPANDGRPEILDYDLRHCAGSPADCTADGDFTGGPQDVTGMNATIAGLDEGATYQVQVRARNDEGDGGWSESGGGSTAVPVNTPPTAVSGTVTLAEDETYAFKEADFGFEDMDAGDELDSVKITELETVGVLELNGTDVTADQVIPKADIDAGRLTFTPAENANGTGYATFMFKVSDGTAESDDAYTMTIDVTAANDAPTVASGIADQTATAGTQFTFTVPDDTFEDIDGDTLEHSATKDDDTPLPDWLTFNAATREFRGTPGAGDMGTITVKVTAKDGDGETASDAFDIVVSPPRDATAPRVLSIVRHDPAASPTNADSLTWRVTFSEDVANVDNTDFTAAGTTATLAVTEATASTVFDVTASGGNLAGLNGTVTLGFAAAQDIADTSTPPNALAGTAPTGADERGWELDNAGPALLSAAVEGTTVTLLYDEPLDAGSVPAAGDYSVSVDGTAAAPSAVALTGSQVALTLGAAPAGDVAVTVSYTVPATNPVRDRLGNEAGALSAQPVTQGQQSMTGVPRGSGEGVILVSNLGQGTDDVLQFAEAGVSPSQAQVFTTGSEPGGYVLSSVGLAVGSSTAGFGFELCDVSEEGQVAQPCIELVKTRRTGGEETVTGTPESTTVLSANRKYAIWASTTGSERLAIKVTHSDDEDAQIGPGWSIDDNRLILQLGHLVESTSGRSIQISVHGYPSRWSETRLRRLEVSGGVREVTQGVPLTPAFSSEGETFDAGMIGNDRLTIMAATMDEAASVEILDGEDNVLEDMDSDAGNGYQVPLEVGESTVRVRVTARSGVETRIYTVTVTRPAETSPNDFLEKLVLRDADTSQVLYESPALGAGRLPGRIELPWNTRRITVEPELSHEGATWVALRQGASLTPIPDADPDEEGYQFNTGYGDSFFHLRVIALDGHTFRTYSVHLARAVHEGALCPAPDFQAQYLRHIWTGEVAVEGYEDGGDILVHGYRKTRNLGSIENPTAFWNGQNYKVTGAAVNTENFPPTGELSFFLGNVTDPTTEGFIHDLIDAKAVLHVCDRAMPLRTDTERRWSTTGQNGFKWGDAAMDWSGHATRILHLSVPLPNRPGHGEPWIGGVAEVGQRLVAYPLNLRDADGVPGGDESFSYQWERSTHDGYVEIDGATEDRYVLTEEDMGQQVRALVSYTDRRGAMETVATAAYPEGGTVRARSTPTNEMTLSNFGQTAYSGPYSFGYDLSGPEPVLPPGVLAQAFNTGPAANGYQVNAIHVQVREEVEVALKLCGTHAENRYAGGLIRHLAGTPTGACSAVFTAPTGPFVTGEPQRHETPETPFRLSPNTRYVVVMTGPGRYEFDTAEAGRTDAGSDPGWTMGGNFMIGRHGSWLNSGRGRSLRMAIETAPAVAPQHAGPEVTGPLELSDAGPHGAWVPADRVTFTMGFSEPVDVATEEGTPSVELTLGLAEKRRASYVSGSGTKSLIFAYTLARDDGTHTSMGVTPDSLALNGGAIRSGATGADADLTHDGVVKVALPSAPLEARRIWFENVPERHAGEDFTVDFRIHPAPPTEDLSFRDVRDNLFAVTGGELFRAKRIVTGTNGAWRLHLRPGGTGPVTLAAEPLECVTPQALCLDGVPLSEGASVTVNGPGNFVATIDGMPAQHDGEPFDFTLTLSHEPDGRLGWWQMQHDVFIVTGGAIARVERTVRGSDRGWRYTLRPEGYADVRIQRRDWEPCGFRGALCRTDGERLETPFDITVPGPASLSVADAEAREGTDATLDFVVTLSRARTEPSTVRYATADGTATAGEDYAGTSGTLAFEAGVTERTVSVPVLDDAHDEGTETLTLTLSDPAPAGHVRIADGTATGTIANTDPVPRAWTVRFGRTVAEQAVDAVRDRLGADRSPGFRGRLAGRPLPDGTGTAGEAADADADAAEDDPLAVPALAEDERRAFMALLALETGERRDAESGSGPESSAVSADDALLGTSFELVQETGDGLSLGLWGRVARSGFTGRDGDLSLDGEATAAMLGTDWPRRDALFGLMLFRSRGAGGYDAPEGGGRIEAKLSGLVPWAGRRKDGTPTFWGAAGTGRGEMTLTPGGGDPVTAGLGWSMAAAGAEGAPVTADALGGAQVGWRADALWTRTASEAAAGLAAGSGTTSRLRLGLEATWTRALASGATLSPRLEAGLRHDGGDAETGFGLETGGGVRFEDSARGLSVALDGRALMLHEDGDFEDWGLAVTVGWDPRPETRLGPSVIATRGWGGASSGGVSALLDPATVPGPGGADGGARLDLEAAWGTDLSGWRHGMVGSAYGHVAGSPDIEDLRLGWRVGPDAGHDAGLDRDFWLEPGLGGSAVIGAGLNRSRERAGVRSSTGVSLAASDGGLEAGIDVAWEW